MAGMASHENRRAERAIDPKGDERGDGGAGQVPATADDSRVELSSTVRTLAVLRTKLAPFDGIREVMVARLRDQIESGRYQPDLQAVARNLIREMFAPLAA
jgi:flagellar biosynthesis anti-sigma factor FlgM